MVTKDQHIQLTVITAQTDLPGYTSVYFKRPKNFIFTAGDWVDIQFDDKQLRGGITYSLSSSPTEADLRITFRDGISEFKQALQSVRLNDRLTILQYGNDYNFQLKANQSSVLIAGGVGIAPFRSMIKQLFDSQGKNEVNLLYLNKDEEFLFKNELDVWVQSMPNLSITYIRTQDIHRKKREKLILSSIKNLRQNFYISGPPNMVEANEHLLIDAGVAISDIRIDSFGGYA